MLPRKIINPLMPRAPAEYNQPATFGSLPKSYGGFQSPNYNEPHVYVDPAKAQEDLKALLEGVIEEEEDAKPRTRSRRKKKDAE
ncbi:hypothetical protein DID88_007900 [Monilinia fructigena]|uniref:Uncharacterized protein n=1 Tax=Monilinia fructigena TaxID=38457 RepID=A0A395J444_9HELO|nr:hypothetical protein DID88_007900 [Monilinia fructigena]